MKKYIFGDKIGTSVDLCALILTLLCLGIYLCVKPAFVFSKITTQIISQCCFCAASLLLMRVGNTLKRQDILGVKEIAVGAFQVYFLIGFLPFHGVWSILWLFIIGFYSFNVFGGLIAFFITLSKNSRKTASAIPLSNIESVVVVFTSIATAVFAGFQLFI